MSSGKKSGLRRLLEVAKKKSPEDGVSKSEKSLFNEIAGIGWDEEATIDRDGALEEAEALATSSTKLGQELVSMIPVLESATVAKPVTADLDKMEGLLGEVERRVGIVRAALSRLETSGVVRAGSRKKNF